MTRALLLLALAGCAPAPTCPAPAAPLTVVWDGVEVGGTPISCTPTARPVPVVWDATIPRLAWSSIEPPLIRLRPDLQARPRSVQIASLLHECGHITLATADERAASCWAAEIADLRHLLAPADWQELFHELPRLDGGADEWARLAACRTTEVP